MTSASGVRRYLPSGALVFSAAAGVLVVVLGLLGPADYRSAGLPLVQRAQELLHRTPDTPPALSGPELPLPVLTTALGEALAHDAADPLRAPAPGGALALGLAASLTVLAAAWTAGALGAVLAALSLLLFPGTLYHARTVGPEAAQALAGSLLVLCGAWLARGRRAGPGFALAAGVALAATALSVWYGLFALVAWPVMLVVARSPAEPASAEAVDETVGPGRWRLPALTLGELAALVVAAALVAAWPYLGTDVGKRLLTVIYDPMRAAHPATLAGGLAYDQSVGAAPGFWVGLLAVLVRFPLATLLLAAVGATVPRARPALVGAAFHAVVLALNGGPGHAGLDGVMALLPFAVVLAAAGGARLAGELAGARAWLRAAPLAVLLTALAPAVGLLRAWPLEPAFRSEAYAGAAASRWDTLPWGTLPEDVALWLDQSLPKDARLAFEPASAAGPLRELYDAMAKQRSRREDIAAAAPYHATHVVLLRRPGDPATVVARRALGTPLAQFSYGGIVELAVYAY